MKNLLKFVFFITLCTLFTPLLTVGVVKSVDAEGETQLTEPATLVSENHLLQTGQKSYDKSTTITLYTQGECRKINLQEYLTGVLAAEMSAGFPEEALKAQAVAARTYTLYKLDLYQDGTKPEGHHGADLCDDPGHCEAFADLTVQAADLWGDSAAIYQQRLQAAVEATDGIVLIYEEQPIAAVFCAAAGQKTEKAGDIWGSDLPYLISVDSPGGEDCSRYYGEVTISQSDFVKTMQSKWPETDFSGQPTAWFRDSHRTAAGSIIDVLVGNVRLKGSEVRQALGLNSANFKVKVEGENLIFTTIGYGHGVGMSQYGARYLALDGDTYDQILSHYYPGTQLRLQG